MSTSFDTFDNQGYYEALFILINVLEYNNENMRFIRLFLANQIAYISRSNDK